MNILRQHMIDKYINEGCRVDSPLRLHGFILCTRRSGGTAHDGVWCYQSIGYTDYEAIARSWLWSSATRSSPLGYCRLLQ